MFRVYLAILLTAIIASCKKDNASIPLSYPSSYFKTGIQRTGGYKVFSTNGEVRDRTIISRFREMDSLYNFYLIENLGNGRDYLDTVHFMNAQHATVRHNYISRKCFVGQTSGMLVLTRVDTTMNYSGEDPMTETLSYHLPLIKPEVFNEFVYSSVQGYYLFGYTGKEKFVFRISNGKLNAPVVLFVKYSKALSRNDFVNSPMQQDFYSKIRIGDTVTIQEAQILYEKK